MNQYWNNQKREGDTCQSYSVPSLTKELQELYESEGKSMKEYIKKGKFDDPEKNRKLKMCIDHVDVRKDALIVMKCSSADCSHCATLGDSSDLVKWINNKYSGRIPEMYFDKNTSHFDCFSQINSNNRGRIDLTNDQLGIDYSVLSNCCQHNYYFSSRAEFERHFFLFHQGIPQELLQGYHRCSHCSEAFNSKSKLQVHKNKKGHINRRVSPKCEIENEPAEVKKRKVEPSPVMMCNGKTAKSMKISIFPHCI